MVAGRGSALLGPLIAHSHTMATRQPWSSRRATSSWSRDVRWTSRTRRQASYGTPVAGGQTTVGGLIELTHRFLAEYPKVGHRKFGRELELHRDRAFALCRAFDKMN